MICFAPLGPDNWLEACLLGVRDDQAKFVTLFQPIAALAMSRAWARAGGFEHRPFLIMDDGDKVGLFLLSWDPEVEDAAWIYHFFIDHRRQRRGLGLAALAALPALVRRERPEADRIKLTVHPENSAALALYERAGFSPTGLLIGGEPVWELLLNQA